MTDHVLDAIDTALADYTVSADAMRSQPKSDDRPKRIIVTPECISPEAAQAMAQHLSTVMEPIHAAFGALAEGLGAAVAQMPTPIVENEPCACICSITHPSTTPGHDGPATRTLNRTTETLGRVPIPMCGPCADAALAAREVQ
jgi:hypothetical protein